MPADWTCLRCSLNKCGAHAANRWRHTARDNTGAVAWLVCRCPHALLGTTCRAFANFHHRFPFFTAWWKTASAGARVRKLPNTILCSFLLCHCTIPHLIYHLFLPATGFVMTQRMY